MILKALHRIVGSSVRYPKVVMALYAVITVIFMAFFPGIKIDNDPENMLRSDEPARVVHREFKAEFALHDTIVIGVVDHSRTEGVFAPKTLAAISAIAEEVERIEGVIGYDLISPVTTDDIRGGGGTLTIEPLMKKGVLSEAEAAAVRDSALANPILKDMLVSADGKALALAVPIEEKDQSYRISREIEEIIERHRSGSEEYHITGLPVAEDTFGVEMFKQMALSAPLAGLIIFILMYFFFRRFSLIVSPMIVAVMSISWTMGLLIATGFTVHIMSSMIPIFLMPIAVVDSIHILSEFYDEHGGGKSREDTLTGVMDRLMTPMFYTSVTSSIGFASLALTPIPPVRVFGLFVAFGIMTAWFLTITFVPAFTMLIPERWVSSLKGAGKSGKDRMARIQGAFAHLATRRGRLVIVMTLILLAFSAYGISRIVVNDNPVYWFEEDHKIRVADKVLNEHFGGTYMGYLVLDGGVADAIKDPLVMSYIETLGEELSSLDVVGKTTSIADVVKKIGFELRGRAEGSDVIPGSPEAIAQYLFLYEMSGDPEDLYHLVTPDYDKAVLWLHLKRGDNADMKALIAAAEEYISSNPPPIKMEHEWAGLTYINVVWQDKMVSGMLSALLGSFVVVFFIMVVLFRSVKWGLLSMVPLSVTIALIYGLVGITGKNYDMPIAVLSALTLGLSVDFAIHLVQRARRIYAEVGDWDKAIERLFEEPVRAIMRNAVVIAVGFTPLLFAPLMPYKTVGFFMAAIMAVSGLATLVVLPALVDIFKKRIKG